MKLLQFNIDHVHTFIFSENIVFIYILFSEKKLIMDKDVTFKDVSINDQSKLDVNKKASSVQK